MKLAQNLIGYFETYTAIFKQGKKMLTVLKIQCLECNFQVVVLPQLREQ